MDWLLNNGTFQRRVLEMRRDELTCGSVLCGDYGIKQVDEPFIHDADDREEWSI